MNQELRRLLDACSPSPAGLRLRAWIIAAALTGLRRAELDRLTRADLELDGGVWLYSATTKGGKLRRRELPAPVVAAPVVAALEVAHGSALADVDEAARLFSGSHLTTYKALRQAAVRAGLRGVTPHSMRHSSAKLRRARGATLEEVSAHLGHADLATTSRYLQALEPQRDSGWQDVAADLGV